MIELSDSLNHNSYETSSVANVDVTELIAQHFRLRKLPQRASTVLLHLNEGRVNLQLQKQRR